MITGEVRLPSPTPLARALLVVRLVHAPQADAPAVMLAEVRTMVSGTAVSALPFTLRIDLADPQPSGLLLEAELRRRGGPRLQPGDFLSVRSLRWSPATAGTPVAIPIEPVS